MSVPSVVMIVFMVVVVMGMVVAVVMIMVAETVIVMVFVRMRLSALAARYIFHCVSVIIENYCNNVCINALK